MNYFTINIAIFYADIDN